MTSDNGKHTLVIDECEIEKDEGEYTVKFNKTLKSSAKLMIKGNLSSFVIKKFLCKSIATVKHNCQELPRRVSGQSSVTFHKTVFERSN